MCVRGTPCTMPSSGLRAGGSTQCCFPLLPRAPGPVVRPCPPRDAPKAPKRGGWEAVLAQLCPAWAEEAAGCGWGNSEQQLFCHWRSPCCHQGGRRHLLSGRKLWAHHLWHVGVRMGVKFSVRKPQMCSPGGSAARAGRIGGLWCKWVSVWVGVLVLPVFLGCSPKRGSW